MAVVNLKSNLVTNFDAQPRVLSNPYQAGSGDTITLANQVLGATDSNGSTYRLAFVPSGIRVEDIQIMNDGNTAGTSYKLGVALNTQDGGALPVAASDQIFFSGLSLVTVRNVWTSVFFPSILGGGGAVANTALRVWELLGLAADPFKEYHLILTAVTAGTAGGNLAVQMSWVR